MKAGTLLKGICYAVPLFLAPFVDKLGAPMLAGEWPTPQVVVYCCIVGLVSMFIGLRAFGDGTVERDKQERQADTSFTKKAP